MPDMLALETETIAELPQDVPDRKLRIVVIGCTTFVRKNEYRGNCEFVVANSVHEAKKLLLNDLTAESYDAVICDYDLNKKSVSHLGAWLSLTKSTSKIPVYLLIESQATHHRLHRERIPGVDDILPFNTSIFDLEAKIKILKKYKFFQNSLPYAIRISR